MFMLIETISKNKLDLNQKFENLNQSLQYIFLIIISFTVIFIFGIEWKITNVFKDIFNLFIGKKMEGHLTSPLLK